MTRIRAWLATIQTRELFGTFGAPVLVGILYVCVILLIDVWAITPRRKDNPYGMRGSVEYVAVRPLRTNTRIRDEYLAAPRALPLGYFWYLPDRSRLRGMYLTKEVPEGQPVTPDMVTPWPDLTPPAGLVPAAFAVKDPGTAELVNAGALVDLCPASGDCLVRAAEVRAVVWSAASPPVCYAVIALTEGQAKTVRTAQKVDIVLTAFP